jgi:hypothetical protein
MLQSFSPFPFRLPVLLSLAGCFLSALSGCAVMSEDECRAADWGSRGYQDGAAGMASSMLREYQDACAKYVMVDSAAYNDGRRQGANVYCTDDRAYDMGSAGEKVTDICRVSSNAQGFAEYYRRGREVFQECSYLTEADDALARIGEYSGDRALGPLNRMLQENRRHLAHWRPELADYCDYVRAHGRSGNFRKTDYSGVMSSMPYPRAMDSAEKATEMLRRSESARSAIDREIRDVDRCLDREEDDRKYKACQRRMDCLRDAARELDRNERRTLDRIIDGHSYSTSWTDDYRKCR